MSRLLELRPGEYRDSVSLMQISRTVAGEPGVQAALIAMATELNLDLLAGMGFEPPQHASPHDMVVAIEASDDEALARGAARLGEALAARRGASSGESGALGASGQRLTIGNAARELGATLALISTPGQYAFADAVDALEAGLSVLLFSDNVGLQQEIWLKDEALRRHALVMGPDCGTAVIGGVGLGFANVVRPGRVGLVAASGTGAQQMMCLLSTSGVGISHCLGVGGRDLSTEVGGRSTLQALDWLAADEATEIIVVISKPPAPEIAQTIRVRAADVGKPVLFAFLGSGTRDLTAAAREVVEAAGATWVEPRSWPSPRRHQDPNKSRHKSLPKSLRGLFAGGTLRDEALIIISEALGPVGTNKHFGVGLDQQSSDSGSGHLLIDFGDDRLTQGRPHPMIDQSLRVEQLLRQAADPQCGVVLMDVVLGHGAHPDPASELGPAIAEAFRHAEKDQHDLAIVASLVGTEDDPQDLLAQADALNQAGASVHLSNAHAARTAVRLTRGTP